MNLIRYLTIVLGVFSSVYTLDLTHDFCSQFYLNSMFMLDQTMILQFMHMHWIKHPNTNSIVPLPFSGIKHLFYLTFNHSGYSPDDYNDFINDGLTGFVQTSDPNKVGVLFTRKNTVHHIVIQMLQWNVFRQVNITDLNRLNDSHLISPNMEKFIVEMSQYQSKSMYWLNGQSKLIVGYTNTETGDYHVKVFNSELVEEHTITNYPFAVVGKLIGMQNVNNSIMFFTGKGWGNFFAENYTFVPIREMDSKAPFKKTMGNLGCGAKPYLKFDMNDSNDLLNKFTLIMVFVNIFLVGDLYFLRITLEKLAMKQNKMLQKQLEAPRYASIEDTSTGT